MTQIRLSTEQEKQLWHNKVRQELEKMEKPVFTPFDEFVHKVATGQLTADGKEVK